MRSTSKSKQARSSTRESMGWADPVEAIQKVRSGDNEFPAPPLPGHGEPYTEEDTRPACGHDKEPFICVEHGHDHQKGATCYRWDCPRCYKAAVYDRSKRCTARLAHYRDKYSDDDGGGSPMFFHRVIISPPDDFSTVADPVDKFYQICFELLDLGGAEGGVVLPHPYRHEDEDDLDIDDVDEVEDAALALIDNDDSRGVWPETLPDWGENRTPDWEETEQVLSRELHAHCYVVGSRLHLPTEKIYRETGWFIRRLEPYEPREWEDSNGVSCYNAEDLARSVQYAMSHVGNFENRKNYRFFGAVANEKPTKSQERRASELCRNIAPKLLGLPMSSTTCKQNLGDDEENVCHLSGSDFASFDGGEGTSESEPERATEVEDEDGDQEDGSGEWCNAEIVHIRQLPDVWDPEWSTETKRRLRDTYEEYMGEPPPIG